MNAQCPAISARSGDSHRLKDNGRHGFRDGFDRACTAVVRVYNAKGLTKVSPERIL
jgi:hypothetical protein